MVSSHPSSWLQQLLWVEYAQNILTSWFIGQFEIQKTINSAAVQLRLPRSMSVNPTFHISKVKPAWESPLVPAAPSSIPYQPLPHWRLPSVAPGSACKGSCLIQKPSPWYHRWFHVSLSLSSLGDSSSGDGGCNWVLNTSVF